MKTLSATTLIPERQPWPVVLVAWLTRIANGLRAIGPYAAIEIVLPGGTLFALLLWLYRRNDRTMLKARRSLRRITERRVCCENA
jgi:hypothetical protein